jgi:hypothetical protein
VKLAVFIVEISIVFGAKRATNCTMSFFSGGYNELSIGVLLLLLLHHGQIYVPMGRTHFNQSKMVKDQPVPAVPEAPPPPKPKRKCSQLQLRNLKAGREKSALYQRLKKTKCPAAQ